MGSMARYKICSDQPMQSSLDLWSLPTVAGARVSAVSAVAYSLE